MKHLPYLLTALFVFWACGDDDSADDYFHGDPDAVDPSCTSVRLTAYTASSGGWCEFDRTLPVLPQFVRDGLTFAIAEPWNGGSYEGEPGEACGECWEVDTIYGTETVMVHDLCPIEGNPLCSGWHFHFDLSTESAEALGGGGLDAAVARRVPCPVSGNAHVQVNDWNEWGYIRVAFINHRIPIRTAEVQFTSVGSFSPMERSGGAWHLLDHPSPAPGDGIIFRLTSAQGEQIVSTLPVTLLDDSSTYFDLGVQFTDQNDPAEGQCLFTPPADVYHDSWGGIDRVRWQPNPWGDATVSETSSGCFDGTASCLAVRNMEQWGGMHIYYRQSFPPVTFASLSLQVRSSGSGTLNISLSGDGERCTEHEVTVGEEWTEVTLNPALDCETMPLINGITINNISPEFPFTLDEIRFSE